MILVETIPTVKLWREGKNGALRIGETRVSLDSVYFKYLKGSSAEQIVRSFPSLRLSEVHATLAYILDNREEVEEYIRKSEIIAEKNRAMVEEKFGKQNAELKKKILARNEARLNALRP